MLKQIFVSLLVLLLIIPFVNQAFGHGLSIDTPPPVNYLGRDIAVTAEMLPAYYDDGINKQIKIRVFDSKNDENIKNVNLLLGLNYKDELIFRNFFFAQNGDLTIKVHPTDDGDVVITGEKEPLSGGWVATGTTPIELTGPVFNSGGLYHLEIAIRTVDEPDNILDEPIEYDAYVSIGQSSYHEQKTKDNKDVNFRVRSYYDTITNFQYNQEENSVTFEMPFDWSEQNISQLPYIHEEVSFQKAFVDFLAPSYTGQVNGIDLFKSSITIDDYSVEDSRLVHFLIVQDQLRVLKDIQKKSEGQPPNNIKFKLVASNQIKFPLTVLTDNQQFSVDLSWDPLVIEPGKKTKFIFTIRDATTLETKQHATYDFVILHNDKEIHRASGNAVVGGGFEDYIFSESQTGTTSIRFEKIGGTTASTEFTVVVVPEFGSVAILIFTVAISVIITTRITSVKFRNLS